METLKEIPLMNKGFVDLNPHIFGQSNCAISHMVGPSIRNYYLIHYITSGCGKYITSKGEFDVSKGEIFIIKPNELTTYIADDKTPWSYIWIGFNGVLSKKFENLPYTMPFKSNCFYDMLDAFELDGMCEEYLASILFHVYYEIFASVKNVKHKNHYAQRAKDYIENNYMQDITVEKIAEKMNLNRRYLSRIFKIKFGVTLNEYLINVRMKYALSFLKSGHSVLQSAKLVGYADQFNFSKMFKKTYGVSPSKYCQIENTES